MLNTQSCTAAGLIWLAIVAIAATAGWTLFGLGDPLGVLASVADSGFAAFLWRNQIMITGLGGFGALAFAYLVNGWRDRVDRRHIGERDDKRLATVMSREALGLAATLEDVARANGAAAGKARLAEATAAGDQIVLSAPMTEVSRLGAGATTAVQVLRRAVRRVAGLSEARDEATGQRPLQVAAVEAAFAARDAAHVLETLCTRGAAAADSLRLMPRSELEIAALIRDLTGDAQASARRQPAA